MAHYKRGKCRYLGKNRRSSESFYRKRHGLKPINPRTLPWWHLRWHEWFPVYQRERDRIWPDEFNMMANWPRSWDIQHHTRPHRARTRKMEFRILRGTADPDAAIWPLYGRPHIYYW